MIHVKEDKRAKRSAELLLDGLVICMKQKDFTEISVSDLQKASGVSRATFYRLFDNVQDVLAFKCEELAITLQNEYKKNKPEERENFILFSLRYWLDNYAFLDAIFKCNRADILQQSLTAHSEYLVANFHFDNLSERELDYIVSASMGILSSILMTWIKHGKQESAEQLFMLFCNSGKFIPLFHNLEL